MLIIENDIVIAMVIARALKGYVYSSSHVLSDGEVQIYQVRCAYAPHDLSKDLILVSIYEYIKSSNHW